MPTFPLLADPTNYRACETDLLADGVARAYWIKLFRDHLEVQLDAAASAGIDAASCAAARDDFHAELAEIEGDPARHGRLDILVLEGERRRALVRHGVVDEFARLKSYENEAALAALPAWLERIDAMADVARFETIVRGILAGNLFDMGSPEMAREYTGEVTPFAETLARVPDRPWFRDELERMRAQLDEPPPRRVVVFADNAGPDAVLGVIPLVRELLRRDATVVLTANTHPVLNDVTHDELGVLIERALPHVPELSTDALVRVPNGVGTPLIDLTQIGEPLAEAAVGADLVVLIGMGRGIESNRQTKFVCPSWRTAMLKDGSVAEALGARLLDAYVACE